MNALTRCSFLIGSWKMLEEPVKSILSYLDGKAREGFTGGIKMGFEDGRPASFAESTNPDFKVPEVQREFSLEDRVKKACSRKFYGTLFLVYREGNITNFYDNRTWQGQVLEDMLNSFGLPVEVKPKTRFTVRVRK
jgi:hypothetical protein